MDSQIRIEIDEVADDSDTWRVPKAHFDLVRASWLDRASLLRRKLN